MPLFLDLLLVSLWTWDLSQQKLGSTEVLKDSSIKEKIYLHVFTLYILLEEKCQRREGSRSQRRISLSQPSAHLLNSGYPSIHSLSSGANNFMF